MNVSWIFCFTFLLLIHTVLGQRVTIEGVPGQNVTLPCSFDQKPLVVFWRDSNDRTVYDISDGEAILNDQEEIYKHRVEHFPSEIEKGNFSIMLRDVKESDAGTYTCKVPNVITQTVELTVKVKTTRKETRTIPVSTVSPNGESRRRADGLLTFLLGCALLYSLVF